MRANGNKNARNLKDNWLYSCEHGRWITASIVSGIMIVAVFLCIRPVFMTIDDARLKYVYAGYSTGEPVSLYLFSYYPISWFLSTLYRVFPKMHWYGLYQFAVIGFANVLLGKTLYKIGNQKKIKFPIAIVLHVVLYATIALISTILMHFEITATMAGMAGVALLVGIDFDNDSRSVKIVDIALSILCITASFIIQFNAFYSVCCYTLVAVVYILLKAHRRGNLKPVFIRIIGFSLCLLAVVGTIKFTDGWLKEQNGWSEYKEYNKYRVPFWDYPHVTYEEDPALFEQIDWSKEFYEVTEQMYFMDERFSKENLSQIVEPFSWLNFEEFGQMVETLRSSMKSLYDSERLVVLQTVIWSILCVIILAFSLSTKNWKKFYPQLISLWCCVGGTVLLVLFLGSKGRLPLRAWLAFSIPCLTVMVLILLTMYEKTETAKKVRLMSGGMACVMLVCWLGGMWWTYTEIVGNDWKWREDRNNLCVIMEDYVCRHPENVYVYDLMGAQNYCVFSIYPDPDYRPSNAFVWGSSYIYTPPYYQQLERNGRTELFTQDLYDDNVYFIGNPDTPYASLLNEMLNKDYGQTRMEEVDSIGGYFTVYKIYKE